MQPTPGNPVTDLGQPASNYDHNLERHRRNKLRGDAISDLLKASIKNHTNTYAVALGLDFPLDPSPEWHRYYEAWCTCLDPVAAARFATEQENELLMARLELNSGK